MRGVSIDVYRSDLGDCTHGGVSSPANSKGKILVVFDETITDGNWKLDECQADPGRFTCLRVVRRNLSGGEYLHLEPMDQPSGLVGPMFGGNYAKGDSRMRHLSPYPLPIHDRFETQEEYDANFD